MFMFSFQQYFFDVYFFLSDSQMTWCDIVPCQYPEYNFINNAAL